MSDRTPDQIEREIEEERSALTRSLDALQRELSPDVLIDKAAAKLREHGGTAAETALQKARQNPIAMAVTGLGLAWLAAGPATARERPLRLPPPRDGMRVAPPHQRVPPPEHRHDDQGASAPGPGPMSGRAPIPPRRPNPDFDHRTYERAPGFRPSPDPMAGFDERLARASGDTGDTTDPTVKERLGGAMASAKDKLMSLKSRLADAAHDPKTTARELRNYLSEGTEHMSESTRDRVVAARRAAWDAEQRLEAHARDYANAGREFYGNQPLIGGLIAFGLGAAIGAALPRTRQEDHYLGSYRDRAMDEAERYYRSEADRLRGVAENAIEDAKRMASETLDNVAAEAKGESPKTGSKDDSSKTGTSGDTAKTGSAGVGSSSGNTGVGSSTGTTGVGSSTGSTTGGGSASGSTGGGSTAGSTVGGSPSGPTGGGSSSRSTGGPSTSGTTGGKTTSGTTGSSFKAEGNGLKGN